MVTNTGLHLALGESGPLTFQMVQRAIEAGVGEGQTLDWKKAPYAKGRKDEACKDAAAFANSQGGLIVQGVEEDRVTSAAMALHPFAFDDGRERQIRGWLDTGVSPRIDGVQIEFLPDPSDSAQGLLAIVIPPSPDMPHMVGEPGRGGFPHREGTQTLWLREFDLQRAYRDRFARQHDDQQALARMIGHTTEFLDLTGRHWLIAAARPATPLPHSASAPSRQEAAAILQDTWKSHGGLAPPQAREPVDVVGVLADRIPNGRVGVRRWVWSETGTDGDPSAVATEAHIELLHDGSLVVALSAADTSVELIEGKNTVRDATAGGLVITVVNLIDALTRHRGLTGSWLVRLDLRRGDDLPFAYTKPTWLGQLMRGPWEQPPWSRDVRTFQPIETVLPAMRGVEDRREAVESLMADLTGQFGIPPESSRYTWGPVPGG